LGKNIELLFPFTHLRLYASTLLLIIASTHFRFNSPQICATLEPFVAAFVYAKNRAPAHLTLRKRKDIVEMTLCAKCINVPKMSISVEIERSIEVNLQRAVSLRHAILKKAFKGNLCQSESI